MLKLIKKYRKLKENVVKYRKLIFGGIVRMFKLDKHKFEKHINEKWSNKICPMCHGNSWSYDEAIFTPITVGDNKDMQIGGKFLPLIAVTCLTCGNTLFVNGLVAAAINDDQDTKVEV